MIKFIYLFKEINMNLSFIKDTAERAARTFLQAYLAAWIAAGSGFDALVDSTNLKIGVVAVAASIAMNMGLKNVGANKDSGSVL